MPDNSKIDDSIKKELSTFTFVDNENYRTQTPPVKSYEPVVVASIQPVPSSKSRFLDSFESVIKAVNSSPIVNEKFNDTNTFSYSANITPIPMAPNLKPRKSQTPTGKKKSKNST